MLLSLALINSSDATRFASKDESTGKVHEHWSYTASRAHFLAYLCKAVLDQDPTNFLSKFENCEGKPLYAPETVKQVCDDLGVKKQVVTA